MHEYQKKSSDHLDTIYGFSIRRKLVGQYAWSIISDEFIQAIKACGVDVLSVGAGSGYNEHLMSNAGISVVVTDPFPVGKNKFFADDCKIWSDTFHAMNAVDAIRYFSGHSLFMSWPAYAEDWPVEALMEYKGDLFFYIGEGCGGCCANDEFFEYLHEEFEMVKQYDIPQWYGIHDYAAIYRRK